MEPVFTRRYRINMFFSLAVSLPAAALTAYLIPLIFSGVNGYRENMKSLAAVSVFLLLHLLITSKYRKRKKTVLKPFPGTWREILENSVSFYRMLDDDERRYFEKRVQIFLSEIKVTGIETDIDDRVRLLSASAAIIPVFRFEEWEYDNISEILIYPDRFDGDYNFSSGERDILGMVIQHTSSVIISKKALLKGFSSDCGGNTAIHEFIHIIDEGDGDIDGLPSLILSTDDYHEWKRIREREMELLKSGKSALDDYALSGEAEFLAVAGEYFFKHPESLSRKSPELYNILRKIFRQDTASLLKSEAKQIMRRRRHLRHGTH